MPTKGYDHPKFSPGKKEIEFEKIVSVDLDTKFSCSMKKLQVRPYNDE